MPFYDYVCPLCDIRVTVFKPISLYGSPETCPACGEIARRYITGSIGFIDYTGKFRNTKGFDLGKYERNNGIDSAKQQYWEDRGQELRDKEYEFKNRARRRRSEIERELMPRIEI